MEHTRKISTPQKIPFNISKVLVSASFDVSGIKNLTYLTLESSLGNTSKIWSFEDQQDNKWIIKKYPKWSQKEDVFWIHKYMNLLHEKGYPLSIHRGQPVEIDGHMFAVYEYAKGVQFDSNNTKHLREMAIGLKDLHDFSSDLVIEGARNWPVVADFKPDICFLDTFDLGILANEVEIKRIKILIIQAYKIITSIFKLSQKKTTPIHGDYRTKNIKFSSMGISKVFDFGNARNDCLEADITLTLNDLHAVYLNGDWKENQMEFLSIYNEHGHISKVIPEFIYGSGLTLLTRESIYLIKEYIHTSRRELLADLERVISELEFQLNNLHLQMNMFEEVFSKSKYSII